jgi:hypothetical protein
VIIMTNVYAQRTRGPKELDEKLIADLASIQCTNEEIAAIVDCSVDTLSRRFADLIEKNRKAGHCSLRRSQWVKALKGHSGDTVMLKHLGKVYLGQGDEPTTTSQQTLFEKFDTEMTKNVSKPKCE